MLRIAIDATPILPKPSGIGLYVANLIQALAALQSPENFELETIYQPGLKNWLRGNLSFPSYLAAYPNLRSFPVPVRLSNLLIQFPSLFLSTFEQSFGAPNIVHGTNYTVLPFQHTRRVMTIYDLTFVRYPEYANSTVKAYVDRVQRCLQWTDLVFTISESSKQDIIKFLNFNPEKIVVTPLASRYSANEWVHQESVDHSFSKSPSVSYDFSKPYILFVSTIEPRKNLTHLIAAFDYLKHKYRLEHQLVLIGQKGWLYEKIFEQIERSPHRESIHHLSYLSDNLVALFYSKADVFVYPSHYEGFGLPVLEAMTLGAPVVTANTSSLPEVAGDAALLVDPNQVLDIAEAILQVVSDRAFRSELIAKGKARSQQYSWQNTAQETLKAYKLLVS
ncbi:MAG: glycosyltransferase family 4 protein [Leptolyngbyaceae cyanobacterium CSU_1_3]|nr:glycosyltransferase family 4 protein [Leptolyngbyaceae cyanobacterium CSU_1_3]